MSNSIKIIAHRGASFEAPENTLASIKRALEIGVEGIEIDVRLTKDKQVVLFHDKTIQGKPVEKLSFNEFQRLAPKAPLLSSALEIDRGSCFLLVEVKYNVDDLQTLCLKTQEILHNAKGIIIASFSPQVLEHITQFPRFAIAHKEEELRAFTKADGFALHHSWAGSNEAAKLFKESTLFFWTVDEPSMAKRLSQCCHGIISNKPRELKAALGK